MHNNFFLDKLPWSYQAYAIHNYGLASLSTHWCAGALITHCIHQRQFFRFVQSPVMQCVTCSFNCLQRDWTHSKCFGEILQRILYESMTSVLYSSDKLTFINCAAMHGKWEQLSVSLTAIKLRCRPHWVLTAHTLTILGIIWPTSKLYSSHAETTHNVLFPDQSPLCCHPQRRVTCYLRNIQTNAALTSLLGPPMNTVMRGGVRSLKRCKPLAR